MYKSRKLLALICSIAMIFSMFANVAIVSADDAKGFVITEDVALSTELEKVIDVSTVGMTDGINSAKIVLEFDPENIASVAMHEFAIPAVSPIVNDAKVPEGKFIISFSTGATTYMGTSVAKVKITLKESKDLVVTLGRTSTLEASDGSELDGSTLPEASVTVVAPTPIPTEAPTPSPIPTAEPVEQGLEFTLDEEASTDLEKVINVSAVGMADGISSSKIVAEFDADKVAAVEMLEFAIPAVSPIVNDAKVAEGKFIISFSTGATPYAGTLITKIKVTLKEALTEQMVVSLGTSSTLEAADGSEMDGSTLPASYVVLSPAEVEATDPPSTTTPEPGETTPEPTTAPTANPRPTPIVEATATPEVTDAPVDPTPIPIPTAEPVAQGLEFTLDEEASTDLEKVINVSAVGMADGISSSKIVAEFDADKVAAVEMLEFAIPAVSPIVNDAKVAEGKFIISFSTGATPYTGTLITKIKVTLKEALTEQMVVSLGTSSTLEAADGSEMDGSTLPASYVVLSPAPAATVPPTETPKPTVAPTEAPVIDTIALGSLVDADKAAAIEEANPATPSNAYVTIETNGVYGTDYVAKIGDTVLTEAEFINKISGYDGSVADAIRNIDLVVYTDGTTIKADLNDATTNTIVDSGEQTVTKATPAPQKVPTIKWSKTSVTVTVNKTVSASVTVKNQPEDYTIEYEIEDGDTYIDFEVNEKDQKKITIEGNKVGTAYIVAVLKDADGNVVAEAGKLKVNVKKAGTTSSGSSSSGAGSIGTIAGSQQPTGNGGLWRPDSNVAVSFTDLGQAAWAADAINYLAARGIVNGRSATIFDPNASITRAEFTKLVLTVYGITPPADAFTASSYSDVNISAWYGSYIEAGSMLGIVTGYPDGTFRPDALVSRQEMAVMMYRAANARGTVLPVVNAATAWADAAMIGDWAAEAVTALNVAGIMNGTSATTFEPTAAATRAQAAQMIYNLYTVTQ